MHKKVFVPGKNKEKWFQDSTDEIKLFIKGGNGIFTVGVNSVERYCNTYDFLDKIYAIERHVAQLSLMADQGLACGVTNFHTVHGDFENVVWDLITPKVSIVEVDLYLTCGPDAFGLVTRLVNVIQAPIFAVSWTFMDDRKKSAKHDELIQELEKTCSKKFDWHALCEGNYRDDSACATGHVIVEKKSSRNKQATDHFLDMARGVRNTPSTGRAAENTGSVKRAIALGEEAGLTKEEVFAFLRIEQRVPTTVAHKATRKFRKATRIRWTDKADNTLIEGYRKGRSASKIAEEVGRSILSIRNRAYQLRREGIDIPSRQIRTSTVWTSSMDSILIESYKNRLPAAKIAGKLGVPTSSVYASAQRLKRKGVDIPNLSKGKKSRN